MKSICLGIGWLMVVMQGPIPTFPPGEEIASQDSGPLKVRFRKVELPPELKAEIVKQLEDVKDDFEKENVPSAEKINYLMNLLNVIPSRYVRPTGEQPQMLPAPPAGNFYAGYPTLANPPQSISSKGTGALGLDEEDLPGQGPIFLSIGILVIEAMILGMMTFLLYRKRIRMDLFYKGFGLTLILTAGLTLIVSGYTSKQITGMMALLGTVAGYLLGQAGPGSSKGTKQAEDKPHATSHAAGHKH